MNSLDLRRTYSERFHKVLGPVAEALQSELKDYFDAVSRIDRISARPKSIERFLAKAAIKSEAGQPKYDDPLNQIQDQVGARIITFYLSDIDRIAAIVEKYYRQVEAQTLLPDSQWKFGYFGRHYILLTPTSVIKRNFDRRLVPDFFELQIKTLFQHAWAEGNHDVGYKPGGVPLSPDDERALAFASAQAWGADHMFDQVWRRRTASTT